MNNCQASYAEMPPIAIISSVVEPKRATVQTVIVAWSLYLGLTVRLYSPQNGHYTYTLTAVRMKRLTAYHSDNQTSNLDFNYLFDDLNFSLWMFVLIWRTWWLDTCGGV